MDRTQLTTLYDHDQRIDVEYPDSRREVTPEVVRHIDTSDLRQGRQESMIRNFQSTSSAWGAAHDGKGRVKNALLYGDADFSTNLRFVIYTELPPGTSIGYHTHGNDEEVYVILEGRGTMTSTAKRTKSAQAM